MSSFIFETSVAQISREMFCHSTETIFSSCSLLERLCCSTFLFKISQKFCIELKSSGHSFCFFSLETLVQFWQSVWIVMLEYSPSARFLETGSHVSASILVYIQTFKTSMKSCHCVSILAQYVVNLATLLALCFPMRLGQGQLAYE